MKKISPWLALVLAACGGGPTEISQESAAIGAALTKAGLLSGRVGGFNAYALAQAFQTRKLTLVSEPGGATAEYDAAAVFIVWDMSATQGALETGWYNGVVAWRGLNVAEETVDRMIAVGAAGSGATSFSTISIQMHQVIEQRIGEGLFYVRSPEALYDATTGTYSAVTASFGNPRACARPMAVPEPPVSCVLQTGTLSGSFNFGGTRVSGTGADQMTQPMVSFELPAIQVIITAR